MKIKNILLSLCVSVAMIASSKAVLAVSYNGQVINQDSNGYFHVIGSNGDTLTLVSSQASLDSIILQLIADVDAMLRAIASNTRPQAATTEPNGSVYIYFDIDGNEVNPFISSGTIRFSVPTSWLEANALSSQDISLWHFTNGTWTQLATQIISQTSNSVHYSASTPNFSPFAVVGTAGAQTPIGGGASLAATGDNLFYMLTISAGLFVLGATLMFKGSKAK